MEGYVAGLVFQTLQWKFCLITGDGQFRLHIPDARGFTGGPIPESCPYTRLLL